MEAAADVGMGENFRVAQIIGIRPAARATTIKPAGTTSCVVGTASGVHAWHGPKYIRNIQCRVGDDLYTFFTTYHPELIQVMEYDPMSAVIGIPQIAPEGAILREEESALDLLWRIKALNLDWVHNGHRRGPNTNNVSATISVKEKEWHDVGEWMWNNRHSFNGLSVLPFDGGTYKNAPFEEVSDEVFNRKLAYITENPIDLTLIREEQDNTTVKESVACSGGSCEII
jgi:ribonucleoside-triphosphate reductase